MDGVTLYYAQLCEKLITNFFTRRHSPGINVDLYNPLQPTTNMFHSRFTTRVAAGTSLYICWLYLHHYYNHPLSFIALGSKCCSICSMGWLYCKYVQTRLELCKII